MDRRSAQDWLDRYVAAWRTYDPHDIADLFAADVSMVITLGALMADVAHSRPIPVAVDGDTVVATGRSRYREVPDGPVVRTYDNCFVMRFDEAGRCREFTEYFLKHP